MKKTTLVLWHVALVWAFGILFTYSIVNDMSKWTTIGFAIGCILHAVEFSIFFYTYRFVPRFVDFFPIYVKFASMNGGIHSLKFTSILSANFYRAFDGALRFNCVVFDKKHRFGVEGMRLVCIKPTRW